MIKVKINPLQGINIAGVGSIHLGDKKTKVDKVIGKPSPGSDNEECFYRKYDCKICFDKNSCVEFIEFNNPALSLKKKIDVSIYEINPFELEGKKLVEILTKENNGEIDDSEADYSYAFLNTSVGVWRDSSPKELKKELKEAKQNGEYEEDKEYWEEELEKSKYFWTIGIGKKNYYKG